MPKIKYSQYKKDATQEYCDIKQFYKNKFYSLYMNAYAFDGLTYEESYYLLKKMWCDGTILALIGEGTKPIEITEETKYQNGMIALCPYATSEWTLYDFPSKVTPINLRNSPMIPKKVMQVGSDCVVGFAHSSHKSIEFLVNFYVEKITDIEQTINTNLFTHKLPRLIVCSPEDKARVQELMSKIENGEKALYLDATDMQSIKNVLDGGGTYIIDKLYAYKTSLENELLTFLGIDNIGQEKKERLIVDEANANNDIINDGSDCFLDTMNAFCEEVTNVLGFPIKVKAKASPVVAESNKEKQPKEEK